MDACDRNQYHCSKGDWKALVQPGISLNLPTRPVRKEQISFLLVDKTNNGYHSNCMENPRPPLRTSPPLVLTPIPPRTKYSLEKPPPPQPRRSCPRHAQIHTPPLYTRAATFSIPPQPPKSLADMIRQQRAQIIISTPQRSFLAEIDFERRIRRDRLWMQ